MWHFLQLGPSIQSNLSKLFELQYFWQKVKCVTTSSILVLKGCQQNIFSRCNQTCLFGPSKDHIIITFIFSQWNAKLAILAEIASHITIAPSVNIIPTWFLQFLFQLNVANPQVRFLSLFVALLLVFLLSSPFFPPRSLMLTWRLKCHDCQKWWPKLWKYLKFLNCDLDKSVLCTFTTSLVTFTTLRETQFPFTNHVLSEKEYAKSRVVLNWNLLSRDSLYGPLALPLRVSLLSDLPLTCLGKKLELFIKSELF